MDKVRVGVVGLRFGQFHVRTVAHMTDAQLVAIADQSPVLPDGIEAYAARYGAKGYATSAEMFEGEDLDAVLIATSPRYREPVIRQAGEHGVAMFIEKPWATNTRHARTLIELCEGFDVPAMVGFSFRYHPAIVRLHELMQGELGAGWMLNGEYVFDFLPPADGWLWDPENGNGLFNENSCHLFDAVCYLMGTPVSVMAEAVNFAGRPSEEAAAILIRFASGGIAGLTVGGYGASAHWDFPRIDVTTEHGQARLKGRHHMWESLTWTTRDRDTVQSLTQPPEILGTTRYTHALTDFFACVREGRPPSSTPQDGLIAVAMAEAVTESARTGQKIRLDI